MASLQLVQQYQALLVKAPLGEAQRTQLVSAAASASDTELQETIAAFAPLVDAYVNLPDDAKQQAESASLDVKSMTPEMLWGLSEAQIRSMAVLQSILEYCIIVAGDRNVTAARAIGDALSVIVDRHPDWEKTAPDLLSLYDDCIALTEYIRLPALTRLQLRDLFQYRFLVLFKNNLDANAFIDDYLVTFTSFIPSRTLPQDFETIVTAIRNNEEYIGTTDLDRGERGTVPPTVRNWLLDYEAVSSSEKPRGAVEESAYLTQSRNVRKLSPDDRVLLEKVLRTFDALIFPERHREVVPEAPISSPLAITHQTPLTPPPAPSRTLPATREVAQKKRIPEVQQNVQTKQGDPLAMLANLVLPPQGIAVGGAEAFIAASLSLAEANFLERAITAPTIREAFIAYLKTKNAPDLLEGFRLTPTMPKFMSLFLQWILQERGLLSQNDAARVGARIINILKKQGNEKYSRIAYFDSATNTFKWS